MPETSVDLPRVSASCAFFFRRTFRAAQRNGFWPRSQLTSLFDGLRTTLQSRFRAETASGFGRFARVESSMVVSTQGVATTCNIFHRHWLCRQRARAAPAMRPPALRGAPAEVKGDTSVVLTARCEPPKNASPLAVIATCCQRAEKGRGRRSRWDQRRGLRVH